MAGVWQAFYTGLAGLAGLAGWQENPSKAYFFTMSHSKITLEDLRTLKPGESQLVPFDLWEAYTKRDNLVVTGQDWDKNNRCPMVYAISKRKSESDGHCEGNCGERKNKNAH